MGKAARVVQDWMLPGAIVLGVSLYFLYRAIPALHPVGHQLHVAASEGQRLVIALLLFFQFVKISPHDLRFRRWHLWALLFQVLSFLALAAVVAFSPDGEIRILLECAMLCLICPTASAAGVITEKLGGTLAGTVTYLTLSNLAATFLIPTVIPLVRPSADLGFWAYVGRIALKVFPVLVLPGLLAWLIRYTTHRLQRVLMRLSRYAFYIWGVGLTLAMLLATQALALSHLSAGAVACCRLLRASVPGGALYREGPQREPDRGPGPRAEEHRLPYLAWLQLLDPGHLGRRRPLCHLAEPLQQLAALPRRPPPLPVTSLAGHRPSR